MTRKFKIMDANEAVAYIAYRVNEIIAIYPISPGARNLKTGGRYRPAEWTETTLLSE